MLLAPTPAATPVALAKTLVVGPRPGRGGNVEQKGGVLVKCWLTKCHFENTNCILGPSMCGRWCCVLFWWETGR
ncbi:hypothetical protein LZ30DRAFT_703762 [Colletotrichum cereale]|nr:hypothetical protein LZ30DRAFT_703762 [Colletotrichum cereale]